MRDGRLLLIDDDRAIHNALDRELTTEVETIYHAHEPETGIRMALEHKPDVVLLDMNMPRMDGLKVCRHLKESSVTRDIPVVFVTVDRRAEDVARALECGGSDYVLKPFQPVELRARVRAALRHKRMLDLLRERAWIDALTGLKNRAALDDALVSVEAAFDRGGQPVGLLLFDLDDFKQINDRYGHGLGDDALRAVGRTLLSCCRPYDIPCRYGGDEFGVVFGQTAGDEAEQAARRLMDAVSEVGISAGEETISIACSAGLATTHGVSSMSAGELLERADTALYEAKRSGGGDLVIAPPPDGDAVK